MAQSQHTTSHLERTASEPRGSCLHEVVIHEIRTVNSSIRLFKLGIPEGTSVEFLPGQWLDTFVPSTSKAGGFTITSTPSAACRHRSRDETNIPYLELAIQESPSNPAAAYLFRPVSDLLGTTIKVRVGGSFVFPPTGVTSSSIRRIVFVAGGVGINPLISMVSYLAEHRGRITTSSEHVDVRFLYSTRVHSTCADAKPKPSQVLFLQRLAGLFARGELQGQLNLYLTGDGPYSEEFDSLYGQGEKVKTERRRINASDLREAVGIAKDSTVVYVCGVPSMTDDLVALLTSPEGLDLPQNRVLHEKWW